MKKAVIYSRFSCSKQREASIEDQLRVCNEFADHEGYKVVREYCDYAVSGRTSDRPQFKQMMSNAGESDVIIVYMMDRFSRDAYDAPALKYELMKKGVRLISAMELIPDTPEGMILDKVLEGMAAMESMKNSERTKRGMKGNALKCMHNGVRVFGYSHGQDGRYVINEEDAVFVREAYERRIKGESPNAIARDFATRGVKTYSGKPCSHTMVQRILTNEKYTGTYIFGDVRVEGGMPVIIDKGVFESCQKSPRAKRRKEEKWRPFPLSKRAVCMCGSALSGKTANGNGGQYAYYGCGKKCRQTKPVRADWLEETIAKALRDVFGNESELDRVARLLQEYHAGSEGRARYDKAVKARKDAKKDLDNIMNAIKKGIYHPTMQEEIDQANDIIERATVEIALYDDKPQFDIEDFKKYLRFGLSLDDDSVLDAFVAQVVLFPNFVAVTLNYRDNENEPAYLEIDGFEQIANGSPKYKLGEPSINIINGSLTLILAKAA